MKRTSGLTTAVVGLIGISLALLAWGQQTAPPSPSEPEKNLLVYRGILQAVDPVARTVTVQGSSSIKRLFVVPAAAQIIVNARPVSDLRDLTTGNGVLVRYLVQNGHNVAYEISPLNLRNP
ncbi:MAG TPA: hypothetical protein VMP11_08085 [Verrucomicrobiae bacterium]|nr:hypothetical protein [Verrucomicrobiae bacterium]